MQGELIGPPPVGFTEQVMTTAAAVVFLGIALLSAARRARSPLVTQLGLMSVAVTAYSLLEVAYSTTLKLELAWVEYAVGALLGIPSLRLFIGFVGMERRMRWPIRVCTAGYLAISAVCLAAFLVPSLAGFPGNDSWAMAMLLVTLPAFTWAGILLGRHIRRSEAEERARARLFAGTLVLGVGSMTTDLFAVAGLNVPRLSVPGLIVSGGIIAALVLRARMFERVTALTVVNAVVVALLAVIALILVFAWAEAELTFYVAGSLVVCMALVGALRPILRDLSEQRARTEYLANLGSFAEQMAHDVRNPVAAIRGAAQFLKEERNQGRSMDDHESFIDIIMERSDRLERVVKNYQRMGRVEPKLAMVDVNELVKNVLADQRLLGDGQVTLETDLAADLPEVMGDADLLTNALENLVRNAREALDDGGKLHAATERVSVAINDWIRIRIRDDGKGMNVRVKERAMGDFFTTKKDGTGLGLPFAARVLRAHGGSVRLESAEGKGTLVELDLPITTRAN